MQNQEITVFLKYVNFLYKEFTNWYTLMMKTLSSGFPLGAWGCYTNSLFGTEIKTGHGKMFSFSFSVILSFLLKDLEGDTWLWHLLSLWIDAHPLGQRLPVVAYLSPGPHVPLSPPPTPTWENIGDQTNTV